MEEYLTIYFADTSEAVSKVGDFSNPISFDLRLDLNEEKQVKLFVQTPVGYQSQNTLVEIVELQTGATTDKW